MWSQVHVSRSRPRMRRHARSGTRDILSELVSLAPKAGPTKRHGPSDQPPDDVAHDTRPASAPDAQAPPGSGNGGGIAGHDPNGMRTHVRLQGARAEVTKLAYLPQCFRGKPQKLGARTLVADGGGQSSGAHPGWWCGRVAVGARWARRVCAWDDDALAE